MKYWLKAHNDFYLCKLEIHNVIVLDYYGGYEKVNVDDYYNANDDDDGDVQVLAVAAKKNVVPVAGINKSSIVNSILNNAIQKRQGPPNKINLKLKVVEESTIRIEEEIE